MGDQRHLAVPCGCAKMTCSAEWKPWSRATLRKEPWQLMATGGLLCCHRPIVHPEAWFRVDITPGQAVVEMSMTLGCRGNCTAMQRIRRHLRGRQPKLCASCGTMPGVIST